MAALLTVNDVSRRLSITPCTVYRWTRSGRIKAHRVGGRLIRFDEAEIARFLLDEEGEKAAEG